MKFPAAVMAVLAIIILTGCGSSKPASGTESFIADGYQKKKYSNILVLGTMKDTVARKKVEREMVDLLNRSGYHSTATHPYFSMADITSREALKTKIDPLQFDGIIVLTYLGAQTSVSDQVSVASTTPLASMSLFDIYTSPAYDFNYDTRSQTVGRVSAAFYTREQYQKQWASMVQVNMSNGLDMGTEMLAGMVLARMKRDKIL